MQLLGPLDRLTEKWGRCGGAPLAHGDGRRWGFSAFSLQWPPLGPGRAWNRERPVKFGCTCHQSTKYPLCFRAKSL